MAERRCIVSCEETDLCAYYSRMRTKNKHICLHLFTKFPYVSEAGVFIYWYKEQKKKMQKWLNKWMILYAVIKRHWVIIPIFLVSIVFLKNEWTNQSSHYHSWSCIWIALKLVCKHIFLDILRPTSKKCYECVVCGCLMCYITIVKSCMITIIHRLRECRRFDDRHFRLHSNKRQLTLNFLVPFSTERIQFDLLWHDSINSYKSIWNFEIFF